MRHNRVVSQALIRNGRFAARGQQPIAARGGSVRRIDLKGKTVIPGLIDAHNHIVLVGNRPGWHTPLEHVFTIPDAIAALKSAQRERPARRVHHDDRSDLRDAVSENAGCRR